jgi:hypothetical protein
MQSCYDPVLGIVSFAVDVGFFGLLTEQLWACFVSHGTTTCLI